MYTKKNTRVTFRSNRRSNFKRNNNYSNHKSRNKGNLTQQYNKYLKLAKEASSSGDRVQSEYYYQFTDHYYRVMLELGINLEDNDLVENKNKDQASQETQETDLNDQTTDSKNNQEAVTESSQDEKENLESIESIPFISEPAKKRSTKTKKASA